MADEERFQYRGVRHLLCFNLLDCDTAQPNHVVARALRRWWFEHGHTLSCWEGSSYVVVATRLPPELHAHLDEASQRCATTVPDQSPMCFVLSVFPLQRKRMYDSFFTSLRPSPSFAHACRLQRMLGAFTWLPNTSVSRPDHIFAGSIPSVPSLLPVFARMSDVAREEAMLMRRLEEVRKHKKQLEEVQCGADVEVCWHRATVLNPPLSCEREDLRPGVPIYETVTPLQMLMRPPQGLSLAERRYSLLSAGREEPSVSGREGNPPVLHVRRNPSWAEVCILLTQHLSRDEAWDLVCDDEETAREWRRWSSVAHYMRVHVWTGGGTELWPSSSLSAPTLIVSITKPTPDTWLPPLSHTKTLVWLDRCESSQASTEAVQRYWSERSFQHQMAQMGLRLQERQQRRRKGVHCRDVEPALGEDQESLSFVFTNTHQTPSSTPAPILNTSSAPSDTTLDVSALDLDFFPELDQILS
jgi:hypothetical protein